MDDLSDPLVATAFANPFTTDTALLRATAAGSRQAFALFVHRYHTAAYAWSSHALDNPALRARFCEIVFRKARDRATEAPSDVSRWLLEIGFDTAAQLGVPNASTQQDLKALWIGGVVKEALSHLEPLDRELLQRPELAIDEIDQSRITAALGKLRALLAARGVLRKAG